MYLKQIGTYWDTRAEGYSETIRSQLSGEDYQTFKTALKDGAPRGQGLSCLDVGCGPGFFSILLAKEGHSVTAVDYSEGMLEQARSNFDEMGVCVETVQGDAQNLPFEDGSFDYIVSRNLVWNLEQPEKAYKEWLRLLKPGGNLLVADGNHYLYYYDEDYKKARNEYYSKDNSHTRGVDPTPINEIARELPLSKLRRPDWDISELLELGMESVSVQTGRRSYTDTETGAEKSLIFDFILCGKKSGGEKQLSGEDEQRLIDEKWSECSDNYCKIVNEELSSFRAQVWTKKILENAPQKPVLDILDAGCGPGFFSILLSKAGHKLVGIDGSEAMLSHAANNAKANGVSPFFIKGDCHRLPFGDNSFDLIISRNLTHTLRDHRQVYEQWKRVLRPGGRLLIFDANWHLMHTDSEIRTEFARREDECFKIFGTNYSEGGREADVCGKEKNHRLGKASRPDWDVQILQELGFEDFCIRHDITEEIWDDKEKLLYGATPMFMISVKKPEKN